MAQLDVPTHSEEATATGVATDEFQLDMVDLGSAYQAGQIDIACLRCYCGSGCLCGSLEQP